ncbi:nucleoside-diphosphate-sugar epimerase [Catenuloplanes nepalensis]|uniref:Nucleoside-diphosphate-sugar epimerase n=1 Tax=Catenuloplanes nepalensis TaxID=587533 RepID=A0ABT9MQC7_9ACTN|nr:NAD-dependent epimerase/dehydratase family protein [Catenuloplanes nepalensis]MDP9793281.1 nucleoside-diphosphate-sugar epimerase [Catenuloplanes nepalensis]
MNPTTVLVTGASGFIAGHIIEDLLRHGYAVRGTVRDVTRTETFAHLTSLAAALGGHLEFVAADLGSDRGWAEAVAGCTHVLHTASPNPPAVPRDENDVIRPAVDGTLHVLRAAAASGTVRRVVLTSSSLSVSAGRTGPVTRPYTEDDWAIIENSAPYGKSKALAERAAWRFHAELPADDRFELVAVIPGLVIGPLQRPVVTTSVESVQRLLDRSMPAVPRLSFSYVDVRDVATAHRLAMENPAAPGNRYIVSGPEIWMEEMAVVLAAEFGPKGFRVPARRLPYWLMWLVARFDPTIRLALGFVGRTEPLSARKAIEELGWTTRPTAEMLLATGQSLIDHGLVRPAAGAAPRRRTTR